MPTFGAAAAGASVSDELREALATAPGDEPLRVIVRLHTFAMELDARDFSAMGVTLTERLTTIPVYGALASPASVVRLARDARVAHVELDLPIHYWMDVAARESRARDLWDPTPGATGVTVAGHIVDGTGVGVAVVDSGVDATHPDLAWHTHVQQNLFRTVPLGNTFFGGGAVPDPVNFLDVPDSDFTSGHGTHVAGIVGGSGAASGGDVMGAAPGATIYAFGMGQGVSIIAANEAFDYILRNYDSFDPPIKVVTNSYGSCGDRWSANSATSILVGMLLAKDVNVAWAAGNIDSTCSDIHGGGAADDPRPGVLGVGNYDGSGAVSRDETIAPSSSQGFTDQPFTMWPDVAAPGTSITATGSTSGALTLAPGGYATISGTSMATPHVAGVIALLRQADPSLSAAEVEQVLRRTAYRYDDDIDPVQGHVKKGAGLVDAFAAVHAVTGGLGANEGVQALAVTAYAATTAVRRTGAETASGNITVTGDVSLLGAGSKTYTSSMLFFHTLPTGGGVNPTLGIVPYAFVPGETMIAAAWGIRAIGGAPAPRGEVGRFVATHLDTGGVLFDKECVVMLQGSVTSDPDDRCSVGFGVPVLATTGLYEVVFTMTIDGSPVEVGVETVYVLSAGAGAETLLDPGPRPLAPPSAPPAGAVSVRARFDAGAWTAATVTGSAWSVDVTVPTGGGILHVEATDGAKVLTDRVVFGTPGTPDPDPDPDPDVNVSIAAPSLVLVDAPASFTASTTDPGTWTFTWDADYDGVTFDVDATGPTLTWTYATTGLRFVAARASDGLIDGVAVAAVSVVRETVLVDDTVEQAPALPLSAVLTQQLDETDPQATVYTIVVPAGTVRLTVDLDWDAYRNPVNNNAVTASDYDLWFRDPVGGYGHHGGATFAHGEHVVIAAPAAGTWQVEVAPYLVLEPDEFHIVVKAFAP
ncbi:MAG TPA: S8 family serine peptidase [Candidatus Thermoplasmatota archaeon]|nr:S8 family serine peptidase [Candidatus Thermoplasmatota archaeon]